jgi:hypothetical protein
MAAFFRFTLRDLHSHKRQWLRFSEWMIRVISDVDHSLAVLRDLNLEQEMNS